MKNRGTAVTFYKRSDGALIGFTAQGHSGYAHAGSDIVCAGISALTQSIANGLENVLRVPVAIETDESTALFKAMITPDATEKQLEQAQVLLETLLQGLQAIERSYPRNVRIFYEERR